MAIRKLDPTEWRSFFESVSRFLDGKVAEIEIASLDLGRQVEAEWLPLLGITYDPKDQIVEVALEGIDHIIPRPREIYVDVESGGLTSIEVVDSDGRKQIISLKNRLALPGEK